MTSKTAAELNSMKRGGQILAACLSRISRLARPGTSLREIDRIADEFIVKNGARPAFKGYKGYPYATCLSVNSEIVHGLPRPYRLNEGDVLGIDIGAVYGGMYVDSALTVGIGRLTRQNKNLIKTTYESLWAGINKVRSGIHLGDIQAAIERHVEKEGLTVVRDLCGHGIGHALQEAPQIPNFGQPGKGPILKAGWTFTLEPMVTFRSAHTATLKDGWTVVTLDGRPAAHFEHTLFVTSNGAKVLTLRKEEKPLTLI
jgi:methionyl aminopeptidase